MRLFVLFTVICAVLSAQEGGDEACIQEARKENVVSARHVEGAIRRGLWACAEEVGRLAATQGVELRNILDVESRVMQKNFANLKDVIESALPVQVIPPAYQWAQSGTEIFLNVKFSHKIDAPATLNVDANNITVTDKAVYLEASNGRKSFVLDLDLFGNIDSESASWSMASVGRMTITLKKAGDPSKWPRLLDSSKKPGNQHFWYSQGEQFADELEELDDDVDEDGEVTEKKRKRDEEAKREKNRLAREATKKKEQAAKEATAAAAAAAAADDDDDDATTSNGEAESTIIEIEQAPVQEETAEEKASREYRSEKSKIMSESKAKQDALQADLRKRKREIDEESKKKKSDENSVFAEEKRKVQEEERVALANLRTKYDVKDEL